MKKIFQFLIISFTSLSLFSCSYKPILDQNEKFTQAGQDQANKDIDQCMKDGDAYLKQYKAGHIAKEAGRKAVIGSVIGAGAGLLFGHTISSTLTSTAVGAGIGATAGGLGAAGEGSVTPDHVKQTYVSNCLAKKGYQVIGWQ